METTARDGSQTYGCRISFVPRLWTEHKELNKKLVSMTRFISLSKTILAGIACLARIACHRVRVNQLSTPVIQDSKTSQTG
jgi:hypothetical protein